MTQETARRVQRQRTKGWKMPPNTVYVGRGSIWGNPYKVVQTGRFTVDGAPAFAGRHDWELNYPHYRTRAEAAQRAADGYRDLLLNSTLPQWVDVRAKLQSLRGKTLACWCARDQPCHADVLLELANAPRAGGETGNEEIKQ